MCLVFRFDQFGPFNKHSFYVDSLNDKTNRDLQSPFSLNSKPLSRCSLTRCFDNLDSELRFDPNRNAIFSGISKAFGITLNLAIVTPADCINYKSALKREVKPLLDQLFCKELLTSRISVMLVKLHRIHAIGAVPKKGSCTPRPITDCSKADENSLNYYMKPNHFSLNYLMMPRQ